VDWINLAQNRDKCLAVVYMVLNLLVPRSAEILNLDEKRVAF
jgi:hypothetical protein